jgi:hypothetical protein
MPAAMTQHDLRDAIQRLTALADTLDSFTNGPDTGYVDISGTQTKTIAHMVRDFLNIMSARLSWADGTLQDAVVRAEIAAQLADQAARRSAGFTEYSLPVTNSSGLITVTLSALGHPEMGSIWNPIINVVSPVPYIYGITERSVEAVSIQLYSPDGTPGVDAPAYLECSESVELGDAELELGSPSEGTFVYLVLSIPNPGTLEAPGGESEATEATEESSE